MHFLVIDQSTAATKAILFNQDLALIDHESIQHSQIYPQPGWVEHDAEEIYQNLLKSVEQLLLRNQKIQNEISFFSITNQRETFVIFDSQTGKPLYHAIVWQCRRGEKICQSLKDIRADIHIKTGLKLDTYFPASKLAWLLENNPGIRQKLEDGSALFGTIDTYLIYRLTKGKSYLTDHTNASRTLLFNINTLDWDQSLFEVFNIRFGRLPEIKECSNIFGETTFNGLFNKPLLISGVIGDSQAALFAQRCFNPGSAKITFGSGSSILLTLGNHVNLSEKGVLTSLAWVINNKPTYALEGITNYTGSIIAWLRDQLKIIQSVEETEKIARSIPDSGGVYLVPSFVGFSAPYWQPDAKAGIIGLTPSSTDAHIVRAALESIAFLINAVLLQLNKDAETVLYEIKADGGATKNHFLMQFVADITRIDVHVASMPALSAMGAVMLGGMGTRYFNNFEELETIPMKYQVYRPEMDEKQASECFMQWESAVHKVLYEGEDHESY